MPPEEEQRKPDIIESPSKEKRQRLLVLIKDTIKHTEVKPELVSTFDRIGLQIQDNPDALSKADAKRLKLIYRERVCDKATPRRSGG
jgi:hypothetical protein